MYFCPYCSDGDKQISHGGVCPKVKSFEYHPDGTIKKVEFHRDYPEAAFFEPVKWVPASVYDDEDYDGVKVPDAIPQDVIAPLIDAVEKMP